MYFIIVLLLVVQKMVPICTEFDGDACTIFMAKVISTFNSASTLV